PANTGNASVGQSGATLTYQTPDGNAITLGTLAVDSGGTLSQSKDVVKTDFLQVGYLFTGGVYNLSGGSATVNQNFFVGNGPGSGGTFNLSAAGVLNANGSTYIGGQGAGTFNQTGGPSDFGTSVLGGL